ncbi:probable G-protein coupled receptor Mth-like 11 [Drosophila innubila]|uniref:probable G-protein coupled receptor Mth-like 11 n=1 Tax=Drosophila innubila TaxID=198719 RepID=UPI00148C82EA|nr:probable G-protein coupled receptor Mth-like 11 [Drosophila innubila]
MSIYGAKIQVDSYPRGCLCKVKSCVLFCCEPQNMIRNLAVNITLTNGTEVQVDVGKEFVVQAKLNISCDLLAINGTDEQVQGSWKLFQNETLKVEDSMRMKKDYCLIPKKDSNEVYGIEPHLYTIKETTIIKIQNTSHLKDNIRAVSVFCMVITIVVYLYLPQFQSKYNKCCLWYFICLTISFLLLWLESVSAYPEPKIEVCYMIGYSGYYTIMAAFLWLLVINYNLWKTLKNYGIVYKTSMLRYHIFVWSAAAVLLAITGSAEFIFNVMFENQYDKWQPGVGFGTCWINTYENWSAMIYYYGPILVVLLINLTLSIRSARHIYVESKSNERTLNSFETQENLESQAKSVLAA